MPEWSARTEGAGGRHQGSFPFWGSTTIGVGRLSRNLDWKFVATADIYTSELLKHASPVQAPLPSLQRLAIRETAVLCLAPPRRLAVVLHLLLVVLHSPRCPLEPPSACPVSLATLPASGNSTSSGPSAPSAASGTPRAKESTYGNACEPVSPAFTRRASRKLANSPPRSPLQTLPHPVPSHRTRATGDTLPAGDNQAHPLCDDDGPPRVPKLRRRRRLSSIAFAATRPTPLFADPFHAPHHAKTRYTRCGAPISRIRHTYRVSAPYGTRSLDRGRVTILVVLPGRTTRPAQNGKQFWYMEYRAHIATLHRAGPYHVGYLCGLYCCLSTVVSCVIPLHLFSRC